MNSTQSPTLGSIGIPAVLRLPDLPTIIVEWLALIPLAVHLASAHEDFALVGEACLRGSITTPLFPKLGQLKAIGTMLSKSHHFFDGVATRSAAATVAWDVSWGSVFHCANASARTQIVNAAMRNSTDSILIDTPFQPQVQVHDCSDLTAASAMKSGSSLGSSSGSSSSPETPCTTPRDAQKQDHFEKPAVFRRYQHLEVITLTRNMQQGKPRGCRAILCYLTNFALYASLCVVATLAILSNAFGTATIILLSCLTKVVCRCLPVARPCGYLSNNESYEKGCMLTAAHDNASSWVLFIGDRGVIDWVLNKTMISLESDVSIWFIRYFQATHYLHLLTMTYVAGQKGLDGLCLFCLMVVTELLKAMLNWDDPVKEWLRKEDISCSAISTRISGRTPMLGAIQVLHDKHLNPHKTGKDNNWVNSIIAPSPRVRAWTDCLHEVAKGSNAKDLVNSLTGFSTFDLRWIEQNIELSSAALSAIEPLLRLASNQRTV